MGCQQSTMERRPDVVNEAESTSLYLNHAPEAQYTGKQECKKCHQDKFDTYIHTEMGRSMGLANKENSRANWHNQKPVYDKELNYYYLPFSSEGEVFLKEYRLDKSGDTIYKRVEKLDVIVGSGQHTNSHFVSQNGYVYQAPLTWYAQKKEWHLPPGFENGANSRFSRIIGEECMTCHNGYSDYVEGSKNRYASISEGIDCERCHGPGSIHISQKKVGHIVNTQKEIDYSIVNPAKLSVDLQMDVCQRCHLQGVSALKEGKGYKDFLPGTKLSSMHEVYQARFKDSASVFIMASHADRLQLSNCFIKSRSDDGMEGLTCITCHNPHLSVTDVSSDYFNGKCVECHDLGINNNKNNQSLVCSESQDVRTVQMDNCVLCHMKKASSYDIPHVNITDHRIVKRPQSREVDLAAVSQSEDEKQKDFIRLFCRTNLNPSKLSGAKAYLNYFEKYAKNPLLLDSAKWYLSRAKEMNEAPDSILRKYWIQLDFLRGDYRKVTEHGSKTVELNGWTAYRIGQSYLNMEKVPEAIQWLERAVQYESGDIDFNNKLAKAFLLNKQFEKARNILVRTIKMNPNVAETNNQLGFCLVSLSFEGKAELKEAETYFEKALELNPDYVKAMENIASLYLNLGDKVQAGKYIKELRKRDPQNAAYLKFEKVLKVM